MFNAVYVHSPIVEEKFTILNATYTGSRDNWSSFERADLML